MKIRVPTLRGFLLYAVALSIATLPAWERPWKLGARSVVATAMDERLNALVRPDADRSRTHVLWFILDGVRRKEAYYPEVDPFPKLRARIARGEFHTFGDPAKGQEMRVSNAEALSLPGYQAMFSGRNPGENCRGNAPEDCPSQSNSTLFDALVDRGFTEKEVVSVSAWTGLDRAISARAAPGFIHQSGFSRPEQVPEWTSILDSSRADPPLWNDSQRDVYAHALALDAFLRWHPRLEVVQWVDSDEWGHEADFPRYLDSIRAYDAWIDEVVAFSDRLEAAGKWGPTTVIVTTDHGRGERQVGIIDRFAGHGRLNPSSYFHWAWIRVPPTLKGRFRADPRPAMEQADLRPTAEKLLELPSSAGITARSLIERR